MIDFYTAATPNGHKVAIMLEETGLPYHLHALNLGADEQKQPSFLAINPNGRIPAIVDRGEGEFAVFESGAILVYLAEKSGQFLPVETKARSRALQWLMFQMGGVGPMQGQANVFYRYAPVKIDYAIDRYQKETRRLYEVLDTQLGQEAYLAGVYSIADIATWPWVMGHEWSGINIDGLTHLQRWLRQVGERPGVQRGMQRPPKNPEDTSPKNQGNKLLI